MSEEVTTDSREVAAAFVHLFQKRSQLRRQLAYTEGWAAFVSLSMSAQRAADGAEFWAIAWLLMAILLAVNCVLDVRDYRREKAWRVRRRS
jgi:hypothetical protein